MKKNIPWIAQITSWDNPVAKGEFIFEPDKVIVWGKQNYDEAIKYLKLPKRKIVQIPPPHFNAINHINCSDNDTIIMDKYIYYLGVTHNNYPCEYELVELILKWTEKIDTFNNIKVLIRPHPKDQNNWWEKLLTHPNAILDDETVIESRTVYNTDLKSLVHFYKKIKNSLCVISYKSTTMVESGLLKVPILTPYFDLGKNKLKKIPVDIYYHLKYIFENMPKEYWIESKEQLLEMVRKCNNGEIGEESINNFYNVCLDIANIEQDIFPLYKKELEKILDEQSRD